MGSSTVQGMGQQPSGDPVGEVVGHVVRLHRYPLKSADGEQLEAVAVLPSGLAEDRRWSLTLPDGTPVTAKEAPRLREVRATVAGGTLVLDPPLADVVGEHRLVDAPGEHQQVAAVHLVSEGAQSADDAPAGCDPFPRANVVLALRRPGGERTWTGRRLQVGDVRLRVTRLPKRCLGVYAEVLGTGTVRVGDQVVLLPDQG